MLQCTPPRLERLNILAKVPESIKLWLINELRCWMTEESSPFITNLCQIETPLREVAIMNCWKEHKEEECSGTVKACLGLVMQAPVDSTYHLLGIVKHCISLPSINRFI